MLMSILVISSLDTYVVPADDFASRIHVYQACRRHNF